MDLSALKQLKMKKFYQITMSLFIHRRTHFLKPKQPLKTTLSIIIRAIFLTNTFISHILKIITFHTKSIRPFAYEFFSIKKKHTNESFFHAIHSSYPLCFPKEHYTKFHNNIIYCTFTLCISIWHVPYKKPPSLNHTI